MINTIAILGAGTMGQGLARLFVKHRWRLTLYDPVQDALSSAGANLQAFRDTISQKGSEGEINYTTHLEVAIGEADLIIECAPESLDIKRKLYDRIGSLLKPDAIVTSNTSTFSLSTLATQQNFARRFIITHFFNPADIIPLVEIVEADHTHPGVVQRVVHVLSHCGKVPVVLKKDIPGFVANRLQAAVLREACFLVEHGIVDATQVDTVMKESIGMRWAFTGPFEVADYGGLDVWEKVLSNLLPRLNNDPEVPLIVRQKVKEKALGLKGGSGFYTYSPTDISQRSKDWVRSLRELLRIKGKEE